MKHKLFVTTSALGASAVLYYQTLLNDEDKTKIDRTFHSTSRILNLVGTAASISLAYAYVMNWKSRNELFEYDKLAAELKSIQDQQEVVTIALWKSQDKKEQSSLKEKIKNNRLRINEIASEMANSKEQSMMSDVHSSSAIKLRRMCEVNQGLYIKLGQHLAMLDHIIPMEYQTELSKLLANNPHSSWESVERIIREDLGKGPDELYTNFSRVPIASASLAQVHIAYDKNNENIKYAVKVQHEHLREASSIDRKAITIIVDTLSKLFKGFNFNWLTREMNTNLPLELNFDNELNNLSKCTHDLQSMIDSGDVAVPQAVPSLSSPRVLTMTFEEGDYVTDLEAIRRQHLHPSDVAKIISTTFAEQIFRHGFVHCDPHEANLLVRKNPRKPGKPQVVLLDHGLYRELSNEFRVNYCNLWRAMVTSNEEDIQKYCRKLNAGSLYTLLSAILTMRPWDDITSNDMNRMRSQQTMAESEMLKSYASKYFKEIISLMGVVPSDMLLLLKTNDCLRHLDRHLGAPINTIAVIAGVVSDVTLQEDLRRKNRTWNDFISAYWKYLEMQIRLLGLNTAQYSLNAKEPPDHSHRTWLEYMGSIFPSGVNSSTYNQKDI